MKPIRIALIGDYNPASKAHRGIPRALALARRPGEPEPHFEWIASSALDRDPSQQLAPFQGIWAVPGSPYANTPGVLAAIRFARTRERAFLGTCGGFQHAILECAEALWGVSAPAHAESDPLAHAPVIAPLTCGLVEKDGEIRFVSGSRLERIYGTPRAREGYHCNYGLNPAYAARLETGALRVSGRDADGDVRAVELDGHPFFVATLYQPERSALEGRRHPLIAAFVAAAAQFDKVPSLNPLVRLSPP